MKLYLRGKYYYFKPCINGKQKWVNTHEENRLKAKIFAEDYLHDKRHSTAKTDGKYNFDTMLWTDFCDKFIAYSKYNKLCICKRLCKYFISVRSFAGYDK